MSSKRALARAAPPTPPLGTAIVTDPLEIRRLLVRAASGQTAATLKIREAGASPESESTLIQGALLDVNPAREGVRLKLSARADAAGLANRECMLLIYLQGRSIVGINALPSEIRGDLVSFPTPARLFKIQRRKDVRFQIPAAYEFTVELDSPDGTVRKRSSRVRKRIVDLSESGLSFFILSPREAALFRRGMFLHRCVIRLQSRRIETSLKIRNHLPFDRGKAGAGHKIGTEFEDILPEDRDYVAQFVYSHAAHLFY